MNNIQETAIRSDLHQFTYMLDKIDSSDFCEEPFKHIEIFDFLSKEHFNSVITSDQVALPEASDSDSLIDNLLAELCAKTRSVVEGVDWDCIVACYLERESYKIT